MSSGRDNQRILFLRILLAVPHSTLDDFLLLDAQVLRRVCADVVAVLAEQLLLFFDVRAYIARSGVVMSFSTCGGC